MAELVYYLINVIYKFHTWFLSLNNQYGWELTDKQLHFIIIGLIGLLMIFVLYPIFKWLASKNHVMVITWFYVFTCMIVLTFAIEIGQGFSHTGYMEMADVVAGLSGFITFFAVFSCIRGIYHLIVSKLKKNPQN